MHDLGAEPHFFQRFNIHAGELGAELIHLGLIGFAVIFHAQRFTVAHGRRSSAGLVNATHAPEDKDNNNDAEDDLHAPRLGAVADGIKHVISLAA